MSFKVGDKVITVDQQIGTVIKTDATYNWGGQCIQPIAVKFSNEYPISFYSLDGTYNPGKKQILILEKLQN